MRRGRILGALLVATACVATSGVQAQLVEQLWDASKTGNQLWQQNANWTTGAFANGPLQVGNLSVPLASSLAADIGSGVTLAGLRLGGTAGPIATQISSSSGGLLTFRNDEEPPMLTANADFNGDSYVNGTDFLIWQRGFGLTGQLNNNMGDADASGFVDGADLTEWKNQFGAGSETFTVGVAFIETLGTTGSVNSIATGIHANNDQIAIAGTRDLAIAGPLTFNGDANNGGVSNAAFRVNTPELRVSLNGGLVMSNTDAVESIDFSLNDTDRSQGTISVNGVLSGNGYLAIGAASNAARLPLGTVELNAANTFTGGIRAGRGNLVLGNDASLGVATATYRQQGPANQFGYNLISTDDARTIANDMVLAQWQTVKGEHSLTWAGDITQTNNRGLVNLLPAGKTLTLSGRIDIWEDDEPDIERRLVIDGTGTTRIAGSIHSDPLESSQYRAIRKTGTGTLVIDVAAGDNNHSGLEIVDMGYLRYANNDSLNVGGSILARGGAVGVDTGVSNNSTFISKIDPASTGGLLLAPTDAAANLDFTAALANAANMTVAAPAGGLTFTGSITPANNKYQLGGGTGTLTLPNAQLTGANSLEVRNGGAVQLLGNNTYTGSTTLLTKYTSTSQAQAAADSSNVNLSEGPTFYSQVAPTLIVNKLSNGGQASSIGQASSDAANLFIQGGTLRYIGAGDTTDRLFTIGTGGATIDASGTGAVIFSNTGALGRDDVEDKIGTLDDFTGDPVEIYNVSDTSDIIVGMTVTDPDAGGLGAPPLTPPLIPPGTIVTGISDDGLTIGITNSYGFRLKENTRLVFGTVPRTLTLSGSNTGANTIASLIGNSAAGGVVNVAKTGAGTWVLSGDNTYTGTTSVQEGTLLINGAQSGGGNYIVAAGATIGGSGTLGGNLTVSGSVAPGLIGAAGTLAVAGNAKFEPESTALFQIGGTAANQFDQLNLTGALTAGGTLNVSLINGFTPAAGHAFDILDFASATGSFTLNLPALGGGLSWNTASLLTTGAISVMASAAAVPEPSCLALLALGSLAAVQSPRRRAAR